MKQRATVTKRIIREAIEQAGRPISPEEILRAAKVRAPRTGIATVYRSLKAFLDQGVLQAVKLPNQSALYELAGKEHHHHFECRDCKKVYEVEGCGLGGSIPAPKGFVVENHEVVLYGLCAACAD